MTAGTVLLATLLSWSAPAKQGADAGLPRDLPPAAEAGRASADRLLDRPVALIDGRPLTLSELEFEARVSLVKALGATGASVALGERDLLEHLDLAIGRRLEAAEAEKLDAYPVEPAEVEAETMRFRGRFPTAQAFTQFLERFDMDTAALAAVFLREIRAAKILDAKLRLRAQVSEAEVRSHFDATTTGPKTAEAYERVKGALRQKLTLERMKDLTRVELAQIRRKADVRLLGPFEGAAGEREGTTK